MPVPIGSMGQLVPPNGIGSLSRIATGTPIPLAFTPEGFQQAYEAQIPAPADQPPPHITDLPGWLAGDLQNAIHQGAVANQGNERLVHHMLSQRRADVADPYAERNQLGQTAYNLPADQQALRDQAATAANFALGLNDPIGVYHGSPHSFENFDISKVGTGEGAQAYGHGMYFADNPGVAKSYRDALSRQVTGDSGLDLATYAANASTLRNNTRGEPDFDAAIAKLSNEINNYEKKGWPSPDYRNQYDDAIGHLTAWKKEGGIPPSGALYRATSDIDPEHLLDWDAPLSEQSPHVQRSLIDYGLASSAGNLNGSDLYASLRYGRPVGFNEKGEALFDASKAINTPERSKSAASEELHAAGIPGIKYLDQGSRGKPDVAALQENIASLQNTLNGPRVAKLAPEAVKRYQDQLANLKYELSQANNVTRNYVIFDPSQMRILERNGQPIGSMSEIAKGVKP